MTFPERAFSSIVDFRDAYADQMVAALRSVKGDALEAAQALLADTLRRDGNVFSCGNGGSAAIANHLVCDHSRGVSCDTGLRPRIHSLSATVEVLTAIANDIEYAEVFSEQLRLLGRPGDVLITISSSGDSENVTRAVQRAKDMGIATIAMTGFGGGRTARLADVNLHVAADNYGVVEDVHQSLMHMLAQFVRQSHMPPDLVAARKF
ncbi:phosphoheptose isomerase [Magnetospirillum sp. ME-1]|uniref:SIS domain-containing protein n=1 Tax=Magnetospirillum sp. ME-1 TaxID=1639348 RepID=UPI000A17E096|nr:SIS domain-containing protein [Magnetospirillum sp. ME-1]ARJ66569.1 phosphoheptose isomerase [Magnetospirillum sp. ME-1]